MASPEEIILALESSFLRYSISMSNTKEFFIREKILKIPFA